MTSTDFNYQKAYYLLRLIRRTEEKIIEIYHTDKIKSPVHLSIGQESIAVGVCNALSSEDTIFSNYRGHAHYIARLGSLNKMWAELYGKMNGHSNGKAGSMHLMDLDVNFMAASAIVASAIPNAVGYALANKNSGKSGVVICFHGDGAVDEGVYWESLNFAALFNLPILFICENNGYAIYSKQKDRAPRDNIVEKAKAFGLTASRVTDETVETIMSSTEQAIEHIKSGKGPMLLECMTYRWKDHVGPGDDHEIGYRPSEELIKWQDKDDIARIASILGTNETENIDIKVEAELSAAIDFAEKGEFPPATELAKYVWA